MAELFVNVAESPAYNQEPSSNVVESSFSVSTRPTIEWFDGDDSTCSSVASNNTLYTETEMEIQRNSWESQLKRAELKYKLDLEKVEYKLKELEEQKERDHRALLIQLSNIEQEDNDLRKRELGLRRQLEDSETRSAKLRAQLDQKQLDIEKKEREIKKYRIQSEETLKQLNVVKQEKHSYFLRSTEHKNRMNQLTDELEQLKLTNENLRRTKLKRNAVDEKHNSIQDIYQGKSGLDRLEMLVVTRAGGATNYQYYGFRRKLKGMFHAINGQIKVERGDSVQLWFVTNNAKQDFINCKEHLNAKANTTGVALKISGNNINLVDTPAVDNFNIVEVFREFGKMVGMIELEAKFLQTILELSQNQVQSTSASTVHNQLNSTGKLTQFITQQTDEMVQNIYKYVLNDYNRRHGGQ